MLETDGDTNAVILGIDQQDFSKIQLVQGAFPYQVGLQKRIPGKTIDRVLDGPIGSIYVFYMTYGRSYILSDFGSIQIDPVVVPPITIPPIAPAVAEWFDDFSGYTVGVLSKFWGAGAWRYGIGICENIYGGEIDPFLSILSGTPGLPSPGGSIPGGSGGPGGPAPIPIPGVPSNPYPPGYQVDILLKTNIGHADFGCQGQGDFDITRYDTVDIYTAFGGGPPFAVISAADIVEGQVISVIATNQVIVTVGMQVVHVGDIQTVCHPSFPPFAPALHYYIDPVGNFGLL